MRCVCHSIWDELSVGLSVGASNRIYVFASQSVCLSVCPSVFLHSHMSVELSVIFPSPIDAVWPGSGLMQTVHADDVRLDVGSGSDVRNLIHASRKEELTPGGYHQRFLRRKRTNSLHNEAMNEDIGTARHF